MQDWLPEDPPVPVFFIGRDVSRRKKVKNELLSPARAKREKMKNELVRTPPFSTPKKPGISEDFQAVKLVEKGQFCYDRASHFYQYLRTHLHV